MNKEGNKRGKPRKSTVICIGAVVILSGVGIYNLIVDWQKFLTTNITSLLSIFAVLLISYYLTQRKNDERKRIDNIERLILKIQQEVTKDSLIQSKSNMCLLNQRSLNNKIEYLQKQGLSLINKELEYIHEQFQTFRDMYGDHMNEPETIKSMEQDFNRIVVNIVDKCDFMLIELRK